MATKAAYDRSVREELRAQLEAISLKVGVDPSTAPRMPLYPEQLSRPRELEKPRYEEDDDEDEE